MALRPGSEELALGFDGKERLNIKFEFKNGKMLLGGLFFQQNNVKHTLDLY